jgi:molybdopterin converting factor small subunit
MQMKTKTEYDVTKSMLKTIRTLTESKTSNRSINEVEEFGSSLSDEASKEQKNDVIVINDVDVKLLSTDEADMELNDNQKTTISTLIDNFKQQVSQIAEFDPGITMNQDQIRMDGSLPDEDINFVFIAGVDSGVYINADMLKLEQNVATALEKLAKFNETFKTSLEPLINQRDNNI